jgi:hypothetical protein
MESEQTEEQEEIFDKEQTLREKAYYDIKNAKVKFQRQSMDLLLRQEQLVYKSEPIELLKRFCDITFTALKGLCEVVPFECFGKSLEESKNIHIAACEDFKQKLIKGLEEYKKEAFNVE